MGSTERRKGRTFEQWVARQLRGVFGGAERGWQSRGGQQQPDVSAGPYAIECKHRTRPNPKNALAQAREDARDDQTPVAVCKWTRGDTIVAMYWGDWLALNSLAYGSGG